MAEITCPNCQAKYDVPVAALGPKGRDVACANCGHTWHATPDAEKTLVMSQALRAPDPVSGPNPGDSARQSSAGSSGSTVEPPAVPSAPSINQRDRGVATVPVPPPVGMPPSGPSETARPSAGSKPDGAPPVSAQDAAEQIRADRARQLAEIRQIVDEVQSAPATPAQPGMPEPPAAPGAPAAGIGAPAAPAAIPFPKSSPTTPAGQPAQPAPVAPVVPAYQAKPEMPARDPLREKIDPRGKGKPADVEKNRKTMMRKHSRRARKRVAKDKRGNGLFLTGFLLVVIVASVMTALYLLGDEIIAASPESERAITDYRARIDELRVSVAGMIDQAREFFAELLGSDG